MLAPLPQGLLFGFRHALQVAVHHRHARIGTKLLAVAHDEMPIQRVERTCPGAGLLADLVAAAAAVIRHPLDVLPAAAVGLGAEKAPIGMHYHAQGIGQLHPVKGIHVHG